MNIRGIIFDVYGTLIDIHTDEGLEEIYRAVSHFLTYQGIFLRRSEVRERYYSIMEEQRRSGGEEHPEFDAVRVWEEFIRRSRPAFSPASSSRSGQVPRFLAQMYRGISRLRLQLYPDVKPILDELSTRFRLAALSDAQSVWLLPEMRAAGIDAHFKHIVVSSDYGFRKPDRRLFDKALSKMRLHSGEVLYVGNDMYRDIFGARRLGLKTVFFSSNQGRKEMEGVEPDYVIYQFTEIRQAVSFFQNR